MDKHIIANVQCLLLTLRHALKQSCHWSVAWSMKLCWLLTTYQSDAASAHWRPSLVSDKHMFLRVGFSRCYHAHDALVHRCGFHAARSESEWCIGLLLWCLAACSNSCCQTSAKLRATFAFSVYHAYPRALYRSCCDTRLKLHTSAASQQTRPQFCRLLQIIDRNSGTRLSETAGDVKHRWWAEVINILLT